MRDENNIVEIVNHGLIVFVIFVMKIMIIHGWKMHVINDTKEI